MRADVYRIFILLAIAGVVLTTAVVISRTVGAQSRSETPTAADQLQSSYAPGWPRNRS